MRVYDIIKEDSDLNEAPMGFLKRAGNKLASMVPGDTIGPGAQGRLETGKLANQIKREYSLYLGKAGKKPDSDNLIAFLQSKGLPTDPVQQIINPASAIAQPTGAQATTSAPAAGVPTTGTPMSTTATATPGATTPASARPAPFVGRRERARQAAQAGSQPATSGAPATATAAATPGAARPNFAMPGTATQSATPATTQAATPSRANQNVQTIGAQSDQDIIAKDRATRAAAAATSGAPAADVDYDVPTFMRRGQAAPTTTPKPTVADPTKPALTQPKVAESRKRKLREATALSGSQVDKAILASVQAAQSATALGGASGSVGSGAGGGGSAAGGSAAPVAADTGSTGGGLGAAFRAGASGGGGRTGALTLPQMKQMIKKIADNINNLTDKEKVEFSRYMEQVFAER